jgi:hypothetical protein
MAGCAASDKKQLFASQHLGRIHLAAGWNGQRLYVKRRQIERLGIDLRVVRETISLDLASGAFNR